MERKGARHRDGEGWEHPENWAVETFGSAERGDLRRTDRLVTRATAIAENPSASLPESMRTWAGTPHELRDEMVT